MYGIGEPVIELAMVRGADGRERPRPAPEQDTVTRMLAWTATPEMCRSCSGRRAVVLDTGWPLCQRCQAHKAERFHRADPEHLSDMRALDPASFDRGLIGMAIVFNQRSVDLGGFIEIVKPTAVDRTLENTPVDVRSLWNHESGQTLGRTTAKTLELSKTRTGLQAGIRLPTWASGQRESVERRDVSGMSFGFRVWDDEWHLEDGIPLREIISMEFHEVSPVSFPAYEQTTVDVAERPTRRSLGYLERWHKQQVVR
jgi:HK97 family phage prohead protease